MTWTAHTLVYRIEVQARLLILKRNSHLPCVILVCTFINFEEIINLWFKKQLQYLLKTASFLASRNTRTILILLKPLTTEFQTISSLLNIYLVLHVWQFFTRCLTCTFISYCTFINFQKFSDLYVYLGLHFYLVH